MGFSGQKRMQQAYSDTQIFIDKPKDSRFVTEDNIKTMFTNLGYGKQNQNLGSIDINHFEKLLTNKPSIEKANVYRTISGKICVELKERKPILRVYNQSGKSFYMDQNGSLMPLSNQYSARVTIANGFINIPYATVHELENLEQKQHHIFRKSNTSAIQNIPLIDQLGLEESTLPGAKQLHDLFTLSKFIYDNAFWDSQISQVYVHQNGDFELTPRVGNHQIIFGSVEDLEQKFDNLMTFYKKGLNKTGWNEYSTINLKFKNQVVCTKR